MSSFVVNSVVLLLAASVSLGQVITTYDSRIEQPVRSKYPAVDVGVTDPVLNPDWRDMNAKFPLRSVKTPALINTDKKLGVTITGTVANARADLRRMDTARRPERAKLEALLGTNTVPQFRQSVRARYRNFYTNTVYTAAQRTINSNFVFALLADLDYRDQREEAKAEATDLGIIKEGTDDE